MVTLKQILAAMMLSILVTISYSPPVLAAEANSTNYGVSEVNFASGGVLQTCSASFCSKQSIGELTVGNTSSANYQAQGGSNTSREPFLEVTVPGGLLDLGDLDEAQVRSGNTTFSVKSYLAWGYDVIIDGTSPTHPNGHILAPMASAAASLPGQEQFGINLRNNASPNVGSDPVQIPDNTFSFGDAASGYDTPDLFKYANGDVIAESDESSGQTDFTMSVIANVGTTSPGGKYGGRLSLIVVPSF